MKPEVSIILSTYNRAEKLLPRAINSVLSQTYKNFELLIVDDCSTDNTKEVVASYKDKRIKYLRRDKNFGSDTKPKNEGILASKGKYIAYLDDDCEWLSNHLEVLVRSIKAHNVDLVYCDMWLLNEDKPEWPGQLGIAKDHNAQFLLVRNYIDFSEVLHKRELAFAVGGIDERLPKFVDWNFWVRMMKWGAKFVRVPIVATNYYFHTSKLNPQKSHRVETKSRYDSRLGMTLFEPTFDPAGCYIYLPYLGGFKEEKEELEPSVAIFTITYDRLDFTKRMVKSLNKSTACKFDWFVWDNGSKDGTQEWLKKQKTKYLHLSDKNVGITIASNKLLDAIGDDYQFIIKADNDCLFETFGWLEDMIDMWRRNHMLYMSPYVEGLVHNPGGAPRVGYSYIGPHFVEVTYHIGGILAGIDARAYKNWRWQDQFLHGNQDREASVTFTKKGYMPLYYPEHRVSHMDTTTGQQKKYPEYFKRRVKEKITTSEVKENINTEKYWDTVYSDKDDSEKNKRVDEKMFKFVCDNMGTEGRLLDAGCGCGYLLKYIKDTGSKLELHGLDFSKVGVDKAKTLVDASYKVGSVYKMPYEDNEFDFVVSTETIEYLSNVSKYVSEVYRVLKSGGKTVNILPFENEVPSQEHVSFFNEETIGEIFSNVFEYVKVKKVKHTDRTVLYADNTTDEVNLLLVTAIKQ